MKVAVGRVVKPHGVRGELVVEVRTDEPGQRFAVGATLHIDPATGQRGAAGKHGAAGEHGSAGEYGAAGRLGTVTVSSAHQHGERLLVRFAGIADRDAAEELRGALLTVDQEQLPPTADPEEFYDHQLVGLAVELAGGGVVGTVADVLHGPGADLLVVARDDAADALVPFVHQMVPTVDVAGGRIVIDPPEGLLD